jgi:hypothetical protein
MVALVVPVAFGFFPDGSFLKMAKEKILNDPTPKSHICNLSYKI